MPRQVPTGFARVLVKGKVIALVKGQHDAAERRAFRAIGDEMVGLGHSDDRPCLRGLKVWARIPRNTDRTQVSGDVYVGCQQVRVLREPRMSRARVRSMLSKSCRTG